MTVVNEKKEVTELKNPEFNFFKKSLFFQFFVFILSILCIAAAVSTQYFFKLYPCTYCIIARYVLSISAILSLLGLICGLFVEKNRFYFNKVKANLFEKMSALFMALVGLNTIAGIIFGIKHYIVVFNNDFSCGRDLLQEHLNNLFTAKIWPTIYEATGNCVDANYKLFDLIDYVHLPTLVYMMTFLFVFLYFKNFIKRDLYR